MTEATMSQSTETQAVGPLGRRYPTMAEHISLRMAMDRVKAAALEKMVRPPVCASFSLAPGSINRVIIGRSGAIYTGREMG